MLDEIPQLSSKEAIILECLLDAQVGIGGAGAGTTAGSLHAVDIVAASSNRVGQGTIYVSLARMEDKGLVTRTPGVIPSHSGLPRPLYSITGAGVRTYRAWEAAREAARRAWQLKPVLS